MFGIRIQYPKDWYISKDWFMDTLRVLSILLKIQVSDLAVIPPPSTRRDFLQSPLSV